MEALQQQWDNTSAALEALQQADKRTRKHIGRLQQQAEVSYQSLLPDLVPQLLKLSN